MGGGELRVLQAARMSSRSDFHLAAVMGWPIAQSRSPVLHNFWMQQHGLRGTYLPLAIPPERLGAALRALHPLGFAGCNLTIPHKQAAMRIVDEADETAKAIGAISCVIVREDGSLSGTNNDWYGFTHNILEFAPEWRADAGPAIVIGAGGGARAVIYGLIQQGAREIRVCNRTLSRAQALVDNFGGIVRGVDWDQRHDALDAAAILVNTTSQGMTGQPPLDLSLDRLPPSALVNDIVYIPRETPLLAAARARGNPIVTGLGMLLHQGVPAWKAWFGIEPKVTAELRAAVEATL
jgi:shikimate dehydrogenase